MDCLGFLERKRINFNGNWYMIGINCEFIYVGIVNF